MTAKRFTLKGLIDGVPNICDNGEIIEQEEAVILLNELSDENKQLKSDKELFAQCICNLSNLLCENKIEHNLPKNIEDFISVLGS